jgi:RNA polymerase sigma-70 factor (ECF subfamily)
MDTTDKDLVKRYLDGQVVALEELVNKYRAPLFGYIIDMTQGGQDAEEVFQETWFRVIKKIKSYKHGNFFGWLVRIARNIVIDRARKKKPELTLDKENENGTTQLESLADAIHNPAERLSDHQTGARIRKEVDMLPADQKEVFLMRTKLDLPFKEIARIQGTSINTSLARMQYALQKLRSVLEEDYNEL